MGIKGNGRGVQWIRAHLNHEGDECLIYPYYRDDHGYGVAGYNGKLHRASRLMCIFKHGNPPSDEHHAAHSCGNGHLGCAHPGHLFWRTPQENRLESNEHGTGNQKALRRLTLDQVERIRASGRPYFELAKEYGVHRDTIGKIFRGETWKEPRSKLTLEKIKLIREAPETHALKVGKALGVDSTKVRKLRAGISFQGVE